MTDKDVERNVRSSTKEGIETPKEKHQHFEKHNVPYERIFKKTEIVDKEDLLEKFKQREKNKKK
ncbi:MAG: hypothetical protein KAS39_06410 [Actinomycetia bacterium]|nr:hypothetical protein [Actinomycetes bacterium]